jgi:hypothetical protein
MGKEEVERHVKNILGRTFDILKDAYWAQTEKSISVNKPKTHLIFPLKKSDDSNRISEQELRFVFVEQLNEEIKGISTDGKKSKEWDVYYSVETPTYYNYSFGDKPKDIICYKAKKEGRSGNIDLTIHDNKGKRIALIEFKFDNVTEHAFKKDFEKLHEEQDEKNKDFDPLRLFVLMLNSFKDNTKSSIRDAKISPKSVNKDYKNVYFCAYSLEKGDYVTGEILNENDKEEGYPQPFTIEKNNNK